jgi:hypothetical protein
LAYDSETPWIAIGLETDIVASITVTGDYNCKATDKTYRMDTESACIFLAGFVDLP